MTTILRSPAISTETRKLSTRAVAPTAPVSAVAPAAPVVAPPQSPLSPPSPNLDALLAQARESVLAQFRQEAETARELGRQRGLQEGRAAGAEEVHRSAEAELARIRAIATGLQGALDTGIRGIEDVAVAIAFEAVCKMLGSAAASPDGIRALVREAVTHAAGARQVTVRLHQADLATLRAAGGVESAAKWVEDKSVELGGCVVETDGGTLDARLETQVERLRATLLAARAALG